MRNVSTTGQRSSETRKRLAKVLRLLETDRLSAALRALKEIKDPDPEVLTLLAATYFRKEEYQRAADIWQQVLEIRPQDNTLKGLLQLARANVESDVRRPVPEPVYFSEDNVATSPRPGDGEGTPIEPLPKSALQELLNRIGNYGGHKIGAGFVAATKLLGREPPAESKWTRWYHYNFLRSMLMLAHRRERLNREQLFSAYAAQDHTGFFPSDSNMPQSARVARTADGSWNDPAEPLAGAAGTRFGFNTDPRLTRPESGDRLLTPNPRAISRTLLTRTTGFKPVPFLNLLAAPWIQFMSHDWVSYGDPADEPPYRIPLAEDDPIRKALHQTHMLVRPTQTDPTRRPSETVPTHINEVTSWWDGSQIYGSDAGTAETLRSHRGGRLKLDPKTGNLPVLDDGVELTGFRRNWWLGLSMMHTLFVKEHNAICDMLAAHYPKFSDQRLYDTARLVNSALMAKIHTVEWTPAVLPNQTLHAAMNANWYGALTNVLRPKRARRTLAEINITDPVVGGLVGNRTDNHGIPYSLTREFLAVYRLHSLLPDQIGLYLLNAEKPQRMFSLPELRQAASHKITGQVPMVDLFYSFGRQHPGQLVLNNYPQTLQSLSIPGAGFYDLGAVDILRDRERGVPRYNDFRRLLGLKPLEHFEEMTTDVEAVKALREIYASIDDVDLLIGNLAETQRPSGFAFGETLFEVFILNASRRLQADRFFTEDYRESVYTEEGLQWIDDTDLKAVLLRHHPSLGGTGLVNVENAFEPWDVGPLDPDRHPLRQFDAELRAADERARRRNHA